MSGISEVRLRVATYNVHGCIGMDQQRSESRIAEVIASLGADVVALQELDMGRRRSAGVDQAALIARQLGWHYVFEPAMRTGEEQYGDAIVSRFSLKLRRLFELPGEGTWWCREKRVAIWAEMETDFGPVQIVNTHFGLGRGERFLQARALVGETMLGHSDPAAPLILLGDFNSLPGSRTHRILATAFTDVRSQVRPTGSTRTYPTRLPSLAIDHIFVNAGFQGISLQAPRDARSRVASDHYPLVAEVIRRP